MVQAKTVPVPLTEEEQKRWNRSVEGDGRTKGITQLWVEFSMNISKKEKEQHELWIENMSKLVNEREALVQKLYQGPNAMYVRRLKEIQQEFKALIRGRIYD